MGFLCNNRPKLLKIVYFIYWCSWERTSTSKFVSGSEGYGRTATTRPGPNFTSLLNGKHIFVLTVAENVANVRPFCAFTIGLQCDVIYFRAVSTGRLACLFVCLQLAALWIRNCTVSTKSAAKQRYEIGPRKHKVGPEHNIYCYPYFSLNLQTEQTTIKDTSLTVMRICYFV